MPPAPAPANARQPAPAHTFSSVPPPKPPPIAQNMILQKRPLLHPPIPNSRSKRTQQVIYVSAKTPFISAVKRVRKMLALQEGAFTGGLDEVSAEQGRRVQGFRQQQQQRRGAFGSNKRGGPGAAGTSKKVSGPESVVLKATGRAIERCMSLGAYFLKDSSVKVTIGTGSLDVVDDIVRNPAYAGTRGKSGIPGTKKGKHDKAETTAVETEKSSLLIDQDTTTTKVTSKKRKSAEADDEQIHNSETAPQNQTTKETPDQGRGGKRPRIGLASDEITHTIPTPTETASITTEIPVPSKPSEVATSTPPDHPMDDAEDPAEELDDDEDEDEDESDSAIMRNRKTSCLEITITLIRH